ncbi:MAG: trimeric autotransporter adhesin, partial [Verrucomicrobiota bacterium]
MRPSRGLGIVRAALATFLVPTLWAASAIAQSYTLTYTAGPNGSITGTSPQTVNSGEDGTPVSAVPDTGYHFVDWSDSSIANPRTDTNVTADISVTANFAINTYTLTYTAGSNGSITGTSPQTVNYGGDGTTVTAVPDTGYHFVNWSDAVTTASRTDTNVTADISVTANFAINTYTLTYTAGSNGSISGTSPQTVNYGADGTTVTAVPDTGYHFVNWSDAVTTASRT